MSTFSTSTSTAASLFRIYTISWNLRRGGSGPARYRVSRIALTPSYRSPSANKCGRQLQSPHKFELSARQFLPSRNVRTSPFYSTRATPSSQGPQASTQAAGGRTAQAQCTDAASPAPGRGACNFDAIPPTLHTCRSTRRHRHWLYQACPFHLSGGLTSPGP